MNLFLFILLTTNGIVRCNYRGVSIYSLALANSPCLVISSYMSSICFRNALAVCGRLILRLSTLLV